MVEKGRRLLELPDERTKKPSHTKWPMNGSLHPIPASGFWRRRCRIDRGTHRSACPGGSVRADGGAALECGLGTSFRDTLSLRAVSVSGAGAPRNARERQQLQWREKKQYNPAQEAQDMLEDMIV